MLISVKKKIESAVGLNNRNFFLNYFKLADGLYRSDFDSIFFAFAAHLYNGDVALIFFLSCWLVLL